MTDELRDRIARVLAMEWHLEYGYTLEQAEASVRHTHVVAKHDAAQAVIDALNLKAGPDPVGLNPGLYVSGFIDTEQD